MWRLPWNTKASWKGVLASAAAIASTRECDIAAGTIADVLVRFSLTMCLACRLGRLTTGEWGGVMRRVRNSTAGS